MIILLIVHFVQVEYVASQSSLVFAALSQLLVMVCFVIHWGQKNLKGRSLKAVICKLARGATGIKGMQYRIVGRVRNSADC